jgi:hypothetical protein
VDSGEITADDIDLAEVPPLPSPYIVTTVSFCFNFVKCLFLKKKSTQNIGANQSATRSQPPPPAAPPKTLLEALEQRTQSYRKIAEQAKQENNERRLR